MGLGEEFSGQVVSNATPYAAIALVVSVVSLALAAFLFARLRSLTRPLSAIGRGGEDASQIVAGIAATVEGIESTLENFEKELRSYRELSDTFIRHVGIVRYNAFEEVSGNQSYSLCLLDRMRNGVVLTYLAGKNFTRSYAVPVQDGEPARELGEEETLAMNQALQQEPAGAT